MNAAIRGMRTSSECAEVMMLVACDLIEGRLTAQVGNAIATVTGKMLKAAEMNYKYGTHGNGGGRRTLSLTLGSKIKDDEDDDFEN